MHLLLVREPSDAALNGLHATENATQKTDYAPDRSQSHMVAIGLVVECHHLAQLRIDVGQGAGGRLSEGVEHMANRPAQG